MTLKKPIKITNRTKESKVAIKPKVKAKTQELEAPKPKFKDMAFKPEVYFSTNYTQFKFGRNRRIKRSHLENLKQSMNERGFIPQLRVLVTKGGFIIDGQHRLLAAMETKKGYYYELCDLSTDIIALLNNLQLKWKGIDFVEYYAHSKREHYVDLLKIIQDYNAFPYASIMSVLQHFEGNKRIPQVIASGAFTMDNKAQIVRIMNYLTSFSEYIPIYKYSKLVRAFVQVHRGFKNYNHAAMLEAVSRNRGKFLPSNETKFYVEIFKEIYKY